MAIKYAVKPRTVLLCDYDMGGFQSPEMVKRRPAIVLVGDLPYRKGLHTVVPLSGTPSDERAAYHCRLELSMPLPAPFSETIWWVKADMVATVGFHRLDLFRTDRDQYGRRQYLTQLRVSEAQFEAVPTAVRFALGL
jgi:mRNA interferase MazF